MGPLVSSPLIILLSSFLITRCLSATPQHVIPLSLNSDMRYQASVDMSSSDPQKLSLELSTGTGYTVVAGSDCQGCNVATTYDRGKSQSATDLPGSADVSLSTGSANGRLIKENCTLQTKTGSWAYNNQTILVANKSTSLFSDSSSGIIGLGRNQGDGQDFSATIYSGWFDRNSSRTSFTFGMNLQSPYDTKNKNASELHWLGFDSSAFQGSLSDVNVTNSNLSDWTVTADGWSFQANSQAGSTTRGSMLAVVDPYESDIYLPKSMTRFIYAAIPGSRLGDPSGLGESWTLPCDAKFTFALIISGKEYKLNESNLLHKQGDSCQGVLHGWNDDDLSHVLLGSSFISTTYIVFTIDKSGTAKISFGERIPAAGSRLSGGAIAGIVIGSVAFLLSLGVIAFWIMLRKRKKQEAVENKMIPDPYLAATSAESRGLLSQPTTASPYATTFNHTEIASSSGHSNRASQAVLVLGDDENGEQRLFMYPSVAAATAGSNDPPPMYRDHRGPESTEASSPGAETSATSTRREKGRRD